MLDSGLFPGLTGHLGGVDVLRLTVQMELTVAAWAKREGISRQAAHKRVRSGKVRLNESGLIDAEQASEHWRANRDCLQQQRGAAAVAERDEINRPIAAPVAALAPRPVRLPDPVAPEPIAAPELELDSRSIELADNTTLAESQRIQALLKARRQKLEQELAEGKLVEASTIAIQIETRARSERDALLNWPAQVAAELAAEFGMDERILHSRIDALIRKFLAARGQS